MISLGICKKCPRCLEFSPSRVDELGRVVRLPSVNCDVEDGPLLGNSELPKGCPFELEQTLLADKAFEAFENLMEEAGNGHTA